MSERFQRALPKILVHEGGFVNHPDDPGGATNKGITQRTYNNWLRSQGTEQRSVRQITDEEVHAIYREGYWDSVQADKLPPGVAYCVFDAAVNSGPGRAVRWLQECIGAKVDGVVGPETIGASNDANAVETVNDYCDKRLAFMKRLRHWNTFKNGWTRRVREVRKQSLEWATGDAPSDSEVEAPGKADRPPRKPSESRTIKGGSAAAAGGVGAALTEQAEQIEPLIGVSEILRYAFLALILAGAAYAIYARLDDWKAGRE